MSQSRDGNSQPLPRDRFAVFVTGSALMGFGLFGLLISFDMTHESLGACSGPDWRQLTMLLHWFNFAFGLLYVALFGAWWAHYKRPWNRPNPVSFSRQAWSGREAWRQAVENLLRSWRGGHLPNIRRGAWFAHGVIITVVLASSAVLTGLLVLCKHCPTGLDGQCFASIGSIAGSVFVMVIYYDLRIKFSAEA